MEGLSLPFLFSFRSLANVDLARGRRLSKASSSKRQCEAPLFLAPLLHSLLLSSFPDSLARITHSPNAAAASEQRDRQGRRRPSSPMHQRKSPVTTMGICQNVASILFLVVMERGKHGRFTQLHREPQLVRPCVIVNELVQENSTQCLGLR